MRMYKEVWGGHFHPRIRMYYDFRQGPVPDIHKRKKRCGRYYRYIDCLKEKKKWFDAYYSLKEFGIIINGRRNPTCLPDSWDDRRVGKSLIKKSWKRTKKRKQWM